jgi:membrane-associated protease RseP (regulator of RpoE activity)
MVIRDAGIVTALRGSSAAVLEVLCLFAAGGAVAALAWAILDPVGTAPAASSAVKGNSSASISAVTLSGGDPFLRAAAGPASPATASGFTLHATLAAADGGGSVILSAPGLPQASYSVGDMVGDARVIRVGSDYVEIDQNGRITRLMFESRGAPLLQASQPAAVSPAPVHRAALLDAMTLRVVQREGDAVGLEVGARDPSVVQAAGFMQGDIIVAIGGVTLTQTNITAQQAQIMAGGPVDLRIERQGRVQSINLERVIP